jgi:hypothetical protein
MSTTDPVAEAVDHPAAPHPGALRTVLPAAPAPARPGRPQPTAANPDWHLAWVAALDELEFDVTAAEELLAEVRRGRELPVVSAWSAPTGLGPLPLELRPRADEILTRQLRVAGEIAAGISLNRRQATVASRVESGREAARPAYLDCAM